MDPECVYEPGIATDALLSLWWQHLVAVDELEPIFGAWAQALSAFYAMFGQPDLRLVMAYDDAGPKVAVWTAPLLGGATLSLWIREDARQSRTSLDFLDRHIAAALDRYPVLVFASRSERLITMATRYGFTSLSPIPYLFYGDTAYLGVATAFSFEAAHNDPAFPREQEAS